MRPELIRESPALSRQRWLCVSLHDVAPATWPYCRNVLEAVQEVADIPLTLLVVPAYHGECSAQPEFEQAISQQHAAGHELALHGYFHADPHMPSNIVDWVRRRIYTAGEGEFCALSEDEARERLTLGSRWFAANGWTMTGFVAPAWSARRRRLASLTRAKRAAVHEHPDEIDRITRRPGNSCTLFDIQRAQCLAPPHVDRVEHAAFACDAEFASLASRASSFRRGVWPGTALVAAAAETCVVRPHGSDEGRVRAAVAAPGSSSRASPCAACLSRNPQPSRTL